MHTPCYRNYSTAEGGLQAMTEEIAISKKDFYHMRKAAHVCVRCGREDAYTMAGRSQCYECQEQTMKSQRLHYPKHREAKNEASKRRYHDRIAAGLCGQCGRRPLAEGSACYCEQCRAKNKNRCQSNRQARGVLSRDEYFELGLCFKCGKEPHLGGRNCAPDAQHSWPEPEPTMTRRRKA